jgi:hypothetical protein
MLIDTDARLYERLGASLSVTCCNVAPRLQADFDSIALEADGFTDRQ